MQMVTQNMQNPPGKSFSMLHAEKTDHKMPLDSKGGKKQILAFQIDFLKLDIFFVQFKKLGFNTPFSDPFVPFFTTLPYVLERLGQYLPTFLEARLRKTFFYYIHRSQKINNKYFLPTLV